MGRTLAGRSGVGKLERLPTDHLPMSHGAEARDFTGKIEDFGTLEPDQKKNIRKGLKVMCREIQMGVAAAQRPCATPGSSPAVTMRSDRCRVRRRPYPHGAGGVQRRRAELPHRRPNV